MTKMIRTGHNIDEVAVKRKQRIALRVEISQCLLHDHTVFVILLLPCLPSVDRVAAVSIPPQY